MRRAAGMRRTVVGAAAACAVLVACSADTVDFRSAAEKVARETVEGLVPGDATADCADPSSTDVGTTFECTGTGSNGTVYSFSAEITKKTEVTVTLLDTGTPPAGSGDAETGTTGGSSETGETDETSATLPSEESVVEPTATTAGG